MLKLVSWNSNTTHGKGDGKGTSVCPTLNEEVVDSTDGNDETQATKRTYKLDWFSTTKDTWENDWGNYCTENPGKEVEGRFQNPFVASEKHMSPSNLWQGQHRGWKVLKFVNDKLFECDDTLTILKELDAGSTGSDKLRKCVCYNRDNQLGVFIARCIGRVAR